MTINHHDARTQQSRRIDQAPAGNDIDVARVSTTPVRFTPVEPAKAPRQLGRDRGRIVIHEDFDEPLSEFEEPFEGEADPA